MAGAGRSLAGEGQALDRHDATARSADEPYFLRLTKDGRPDRGTTYGIGDGGPSAVDQRRVVDPSFLDLVRSGWSRRTTRPCCTTLSVVDDELKVDTPNGPFWHRFSFDGYGETRDGGQWEITEPDTGTTLGRGWPLLTGERGEYAVTAGQDASPYLADDGRGRRPERHDRRAGLGRSRARPAKPAAPRVRAPGPPLR